MVVADGNAVVGGPGWGIVHHDSRAAINHNVVFDIVGAGIVAEAGSEIGEWVGNLVTSITGGPNADDQADVIDTHGPGAIGEAYTAMSRAVFQRNNIAANSKFGWVFEGRVGRESYGIAGGHVPARGSFVFDPMPLHDWNTTMGRGDLTSNRAEPGPDPDFMQFIDFRDNEGFALGLGMRSSHRGKYLREFCDIINEVIRFRLWRVKSGLQFHNYSWDYTFVDSLWLGEGSGIGFEGWAKIRKHELHQQPYRELRYRDQIPLHQLQRRAGRHHPPQRHQRREQRQRCGKSAVCRSRRCSGDGATDPGTWTKAKGTA